jgi:hypothetical protein
MNLPPAQVALELTRQALFAILAVATLLAVVPMLRERQDPVFAGLWLGLLACGFAVLAFSAHLLLDAALFRMIASYADEKEGLDSVDQVLARTGLRSRRETSRPLADRIIGSQRLVRRQRLALTLFACLFGLMALLPDETLGGAGA